MPRPIWKGHISFGLVNIPVTLFSAEKKADEIRFRMVDQRTKTPVRYERVNEETGEEVPWDQIAKAYEYDSGDFVILSDEDFKKAAVESTQTVEIDAFVEREQIDTVYFDKPYYLVPGKKGDKGYVLLRETLKKTGRVGIAKVVIRTRQYLAALMADGDALILDLLRFHQELRQPDEFNLPSEDPEEYKIQKKELDMAEQLVDSMTSDWEPEQYHDEYREKLRQYIEEKIEKGEEIEIEERPPAEEEGAEVVDMMGLLKESMKEQKGKKKGGKKSAKKAAGKKRKAG